MKTVTLEFAFEKATKNTGKFDEQPVSGQPPMIGSLYIQKWACPTMGPGTKVRMKLEIAEGGADTEFTIKPLTV